MDTLLFLETNFCIQANDPNFEKSYRLAYIYLTHLAS